MKFRSCTPRLTGSHTVPSTSKPTAGEQPTPANTSTPPPLSKCQQPSLPSKESMSWGQRGLSPQTLLFHRTGTAPASAPQTLAKIFSSIKPGFQRPHLRIRKNWATLLRRARAENPGIRTAKKKGVNDVSEIPTPSKEAGTPTVILICMLDYP
jgi:hypothetical protein